MTVKQIAAGNELTLILTESGDVWYSGYTQLNVANDNQSNASDNNSNDDPQNRNRPGENGSRTGHLKKVEFENVKIKKIFANNGCEHVICIDEDDRAYSFGFNQRGQLGQGNLTCLSIPKKIEALSKKVVTLAGCSYYHSIFVCKNDREVYSTGRNDYGQLGLSVNDDQRDTPTAIPEFKGKEVSTIGCGQYHTLIATAIGDVYSFGRNECGQLGIQSP